MLVSVRLLMNVWKFGRTLGKAFLSLPSDTGEEHLLMSGCPTYFADTAPWCNEVQPSLDCHDDALQPGPNRHGVMRFSRDLTVTM